MVQIRLLVADRDFKFLEKFSMYLHKSKAARFSLELFTNPGKLEEWIEKGGKADLMAISSDFFSAMVKKPADGVLILIDSAESLVPEGYSSTYKFRPAEALMKEIIAQCADNLPQRSQNKENKGRVHLVLYADGSDAVNPLAQMMAEALSTRAPFYLNLDELSNTDSWFSGTGSKGLTEMLYYVKAQKENLSLRADSCTSKDSRTGIDFMAGHKNPEDISELTASECQSLIDAIRGRNCCDHLIISRAFRYDGILPVLLKGADKIYLTCLDYRSSLARLEKVVQLLSRFEEQNAVELKEKVQVFITPVEQSQNFQDFDSPYAKICLPFPFERSSLLIANEYQAAIKTILEKDVL